jgi:hypothetical protein
MSVIRWIHWPAVLVGASTALAVAWAIWLGLAR